MPDIVGAGPRLSTVFRLRRRAPSTDRQVTPVEGFSLRPQHSSGVRSERRCRSAPPSPSASTSGCAGRMRIKEMRLATGRTGLHRRAVGVLGRPDTAARARMPIMTTPPMPPRWDRRRGDRSNHERADPAAAAPTLSEVSAANKKMAPSRSSCTGTCPVLRSMTWGRTAAKKTTDLGLEIPTMNRSRTTRQVDDVPVPCRTGCSAPRDAGRPGRRGTPGRPRRVI